MGKFRLSVISRFRAYPSLDRLFVLTGLAQVRSITSSRCMCLVALSLSRGCSGGCMQSTYEVVSTFSFEHPQVRVDVDPALPINRSVAIGKPSVLLLGRKTPWPSPLCRAIEQSGADPIVISPFSVTSGNVKKSGASLVLLSSSVQHEKRRQLVSDLRGSDVSLFYAFPVETGCWWLPALRHGQVCHGDAGYRANEFLAELMRILQEMSSHARSARW
jgi:hypothetical protein